jgi:hypothetical protein
MDYSYNPYESYSYDDVNMNKQLDPKKTHIRSFVEPREYTYRSCINRKNDIDINDVDSVDSCPNVDKIKYMPPQKLGKYEGDSDEQSYKNNPYFIGRKIN